MENVSAFKKDIEHIINEAIQKYRDQIAEEKSNVSANRVLFIIKQVMKKALSVRAIKKDVAKDVRYLSEKAHCRNNFLLPHKLDELLKASQIGRAKFYLPALICLGAEHGASKQECLSLKWSDIDFDYKGMGIIKFFRTKNSRERTEYLMPRTRHFLRIWQDHLNEKREKLGIEAEKEGQVFCRIDGTPINSFRRTFNSACQTIGIQDFHFHDLRHTFCSNLILAGADFKDAKEMIGHSDLSMTDRYTHLSGEHKFLMQQQLFKHYKGEGLATT